MSTAKEVLHHPRAWVYARGVSGSPALHERFDALRRSALREGYEIVGQSSDARQPCGIRVERRCCALSAKVWSTTCSSPGFRSFPESAAGCAAFWCGSSAKAFVYTRPRLTCGMICTGTGWTALYCRGLHTTNKIEHTVIP